MTRVALVAAVVLPLGLLAGMGCSTHHGAQACPSPPSPMRAEAADGTAQSASPPPAPPASAPPRDVPSDADAPCSPALVAPGGVPAVCTWGDAAPCEPCPERPWFVGGFLAQVWEDQKHYYTAENLALLGLGVGVAGVLANTPADQGFRDWYQDRFRRDGRDEASEVAKLLGEHWYVLPVYVGAAYAGHAFPDDPTCSAVGRWGNRTLRAFIAGAPSVGVLQYGLGASRPSDGRGSRWRPFDDDNAVAGHGFIGSVPFLAAASLTENRLCRYGLVAGSFAVQWSRVHDDAHYLSQAVLGWWIAYLAVRSVDAADREDSSIRVFPAATGDGPGVNVLIRY